MSGFLERFRYLEASAAAQKEPKYMQVGWTEMTSKTVSWSPQLTDDEMAALLHRLKAFVQKTQAFSFERVVGRLKREIMDPMFRGIVDEVIEKFDGREWQSLIRINSGGTPLNTAVMFDEWVNAFEYHQDVRRRDALDAVLNRTIPGLLPWVVLELTFEKVRALRQLAQIARVIAGEREAAEINGYRIVRGA